MKKLKKQIQSWFRVIGILLFIWIASKIDWIVVLQTIKEIRPTYLIGYLGVYVVSFLLKVVRLHWYLNYLGHKVKFNSVYQCVVESAFYGMVTPARIGEFSKVAFLMRFGLAQKQAWLVVLMERAVDFGVLFITSISGIIYFFLQNNHSIEWSTAFFLISMFLLYLGFYRISIVLKLLYKFGKRLLTIDRNIDGIIQIANTFGKLTANIFLPISLIIMSLSFTQLWLLGLALKINLPPLYLGLAYTSSSLVSLLPLSIGGLGTREAVYIAILGQQGISSATAISLSLLDGLVLSMLVQVFLMLPLCSLRKING